MLLYISGLQWAIFMLKYQFVPITRSYSNVTPYVSTENQCTWKSYTVNEYKNISFFLFRRLRWCWWQNVCWRRQKFKCMSVKFVCKNFSICWWSYQHTISYIFTDIVFNQHIFHQHPGIRSCMLIEVYQHKGFSSTSEHQQRQPQPFFLAVAKWFGASKS